MNQIIRVNMTRQEISFEDIPPDYAMLGGRGLTSRILLDEVPATCDPLGPNNKLIFAPGLMAGTMASSASRISVGAKSPLTNGIKEANAGGMTGLRLAQMGVRAVIVEGQPAKGEGPFILVIDKNHGGLEARLEPALDLAGLNTYETVEKLKKPRVWKAAFIVNGPAGEMLMNIAGIAHTDRDGRPARYSARGGLGAVMGSKKLKAVMILPGLPGTVWYREGRDTDAWRAVVKEYTTQLVNHPGTERMITFGSTNGMETMNGMGALPVRNFSQGKFEQVDGVTGKKMREIILERGGDGNTAHSCMPGCLLKCSNIYPDAKGKFLATAMEYETNALMGPNLGIADFDIIAQITQICNEIGVDTIETAGALAMAMEAGRLQFGDGPGVIAALKEIGRGTDFGRVLGSGARLTGRVLGAARIPVVKGQFFGAYDPRGLKGNGVTYATSPQGADHTAGNCIGAPVDHLRPEGQVKLSRTQQIKAGWVDTLGICNFTKGVSFGNTALIARMFNTLWGTSYTVDDLMAMGRQVLEVEREFNRQAGMTAADDRLPEFFKTEPLPPHNSVWDVPDAEMDASW